MINDVNSINRLLSNIYELLTDKKTADEKAVKREYLSGYFLPVLDDVDEIIRFCVSFGLIYQKKSRINLTAAGEELLEINPPTPFRSYEFTHRQKEFFIYKMLLMPRFKQEISSLLRAFKKDEMGRFFWNESECDEIKNANLLRLLMQLDFFYQERKNARIDEKYENEMAVLLLGSKGFSLEEFYHMKAEESLRGGIAEQYVLDYEKRRLFKLGFGERIDGIRHVSPLNISAGYDIESFNGPNSTSFDRFIEVKSGQTHKVRFFISRNELEKAKLHKKFYWIYYVSMKKREPLQIQLYQDPIRSIISNKKFEKEVEKLEVWER